MLDQNTFILEQAIDNWCEELRRKKWFNDVQLAELRDHLEMDIRQQKALGKDDDEAFQLAIENLGNTKAIAKEFLKLNFITQITQTFTESVYIRKIIAVFLLFGAWELFLKLGLSIATDYNRGVAIVAIVVFSPIIYWTRRSGLALWQGRPVNYAGLLLFYLIQVPVLGLASINYEFYYGLSLLMEFGYIDTLFDFAFLGGQTRGFIDITMAGNLHLNVPFDKAWYSGNYFAINFYALFVAIFCICNLIKKQREVFFEEPALVEFNSASTHKRGFLRKPSRTFRWLPY